MSQTQSAEGEVPRSKPKANGVDPDAVLNEVKHDAAVAIFTAKTMWQIATYVLAAILGIILVGFKTEWIVSPAKRTEVATLELSQRYLEDKFAAQAEAYTRLNQTLTQLALSEARIEGALGIGQAGSGAQTVLLRPQVVTRDRRRR
jgi:hypothetical protein